ncbi:integral membrane protein [Podospora fimiseda]|uniref:Integral membrane protein n=1 Tax=Podospora fimiseda TaxID=252190 RepID=A0AAN7H5E4_9PEZI|nr:integral membrane protein [Podospora fimiseda]
MKPPRLLPLFALLITTTLASKSHSHGDGMIKTSADIPLPSDQYPPTYFVLPDSKTIIYLHITLMTLSWVFILPIAVMLSLVRSRYTLLLQFLFAGFNAAGLLLGVVYNASTQDLYPNNAHHKLGWVVSFTVGIQILIGMLGRVAGVFEKMKRGGYGYDLVSRENMVEHELKYYVGERRRFSNDSGQGTELESESSGSGSQPLSPVVESFEDVVMEDEVKVGKAHKVVARLAGKISDRFWKVLLLGYNLVDRVILVLGFVAFATGIVTYGRFFEGSGIFSGLAHWIKGGVFFWLGIFTLGRWAGCFGELGWAWNVAPKCPNASWRPSAEFVESFLIFFYGSTNIFLEHLGGWGGEWSAQDLEHVSITVLFIGGGLCGMLIESVRIRTLLNHTVAAELETALEEDEEKLREPETYSFSLNPMPALVILLLGLMMSSHTQQSMISSMVHKQWGNLLTGASFARGFTYVLVYLRPPKSVFPSRPPTELLTAFGLISGGIIFMASASDTVSGMIHYQLDAMFMYTVTMGLVGLLMAWVIICVAIKGWAARVESAAHKRRRGGSLA